MKLLFCKICNDLVQLRNKPKHCKCGNVVGRYLPDNSRVEVAFYYNKFGYVVGASNGFFRCNSKHIPFVDGGYFRKQNSALTKIPLYKKGNNVIVKDWNCLYRKYDFFKLSWILHKWWLNSFSIKARERANIRTKEWDEEYGKNSKR